MTQGTRTVTLVINLDNCSVQGDLDEQVALSPMSDSGSSIESQARSILVQALKRIRDSLPQHTAAPRHAPAQANVALVQCPLRLGTGEHAKACPQQGVQLRIATKPPLAQLARDPFWRPAPPNAQLHPVSRGHCGIAPAPDTRHCPGCGAPYIEEKPAGVAEFTTVHGPSLGVAAADDPCPLSDDELHELKHGWSVDGQKVETPEDLKKQRMALAWLYRDNRRLNELVARLVADAKQLHLDMHYAITGDDMPNEMRVRYGIEPKP